jgi:hypothetical protein
MAQGRCSDPANEEARRQKIAAARRGKKHSPETREKISYSGVTAQILRRERESNERLDALLDDPEALRAELRRRDLREDDLLYLRPRRR